MRPPDDDAIAPTRWYQEKLVWMLIGIPACAFAAGLITLVLAYRGADPEVPRPLPAATEQPQ